MGLDDELLTYTRVAVANVTQLITLTVPPLICKFIGLEGKHLPDAVVLWGLGNIITSSYRIVQYLGCKSEIEEDSWSPDLFGKYSRDILQLYAERNDQMESFETTRREYRRLQFL